MTRPSGSSQRWRVLVLVDHVAREHHVKWPSERRGHLTIPVEDARTARLAHAVIGGTLLEKIERLGLDVGGNDLSRASDSCAQCAWTKAATQLKHGLAANERWLHEQQLAQG